MSSGIDKVYVCKFCHNSFLLPLSMTPYATGSGEEPKELRYEVTINDRDIVHVFAHSVSVISGGLVFRDIHNKIITAFSKWDRLELMI